MLRLAILSLLSLTLVACGSPKLRNLQQTSKGPDEFRIQPVNSLEQPGNFKDLPTPTPGKANRADRSATNEGVLAFGGRPEPDNGAVPARDGALVQHASRKGVNPNIRADLAEIDAKFRKRQARFTQFRIAPVDRYNQAYRRQALDAETEAKRWRRAGARTPSSPPQFR